jgi:hypothetical protein
MRRMLALLMLTASVLAVCVRADSTQSDTQADKTTVAELRARAEQGDAWAQFNLGARHHSGRGVPQSDAQAMAWYRRAAEQGHPQAQHELAMMYASGRGAPRDDAQAHAWVSLAASPGSGYSVSSEELVEYARVRDGLATRMTPAQLAEAQKRSQALAAAFSGERPGQLPLLPAPPPLPPVSLGEAAQAARSAIVKAQHAQESIRAYTVANRSTDLPAGPTLSSTLIFVSPDRYHAIDHQGARPMQTIRVGEKGWMKLGDGPWEPEVMDSMGILTRLRGPTAIDDPRYELREATVLGARDLTGVKTFAYEYVVAGRGETSRIQLWVSTETGLPVRFEEEFANSVVKQKVSWEIEYDASLSVELPTPRR